MEKKLSQKERGEVVTKGFLVDFLKEYLRNENYVTKDYLEERLDTALQKQSQDFYQYMETLMEHQMNQLQVFMEQMDERYVLRREWNVLRGS